MSGWTIDELDRIGQADELQIASQRPDGSLRPYVTIWAVRAGDDIYVRSAYGYDNPWFQRSLRSGEGRPRSTRVARTSCGPDNRWVADPSWARVSCRDHGCT